MKLNFNQTPKYHAQATNLRTSIIFKNYTPPLKIYHITTKEREHTNIIITLLLIGFLHSRTKCVETPLCWSIILGTLGAIYLPYFPLEVIIGKSLIWCPSLRQLKKHMLPTRQSSLFFLPHLAQVGLQSFEPPPISTLNLSLLDSSWYLTLFLDLVFS